LTIRRMFGCRSPPLLQGMVALVYHRGFPFIAFA